MGFVNNTEEDLVLMDGENRVEMFGWSLLDVAIALKATKISNWLLKRADLSIYTKVDLSIPDLDLRSPNLVDCVGIDLLEIETRPLYAALVTKQYKLLMRLWRKHYTWEACHFYRLVDMILSRKDSMALQKLLEVPDGFVHHFYEAMEI